MSDVRQPAGMVGNDFVVSPRPVRSIGAPEPTRIIAPTVRIAPAMLETAGVSVPVTRSAQQITAPATPITPSSVRVRRFTYGFARYVDILHRNSIIVFALLFLLVGASGITVAGRYAGARAVANAAGVPTANAVAPAITGFNKTVPHAELAAALQTITTQPAQLMVGDKAVAISPETVQSWLQITASQDGTEQHIHVKSTAIVDSIKALAAKHVTAPRNQVTVTHEGQAPQIIIAGINGTQLTDPAGLEAQAQALAKNLLDSKGLQLNAPLTTLPFQAVTPAAFAKLIEVNVDTKQMYLYDNGNLTRTYPISAGAPATPTPIGQYQTYSKLSTQDMKGYNADGTKYSQPHVRWISYFLPGGYAIHGNYWRPASWFGAINSSHGCVSLPDDEAKWVFDWAPVGTTVITHHN